jgi:hypothetical protein
MAIPSYCFSMEQRESNETGLSSAEALCLPVFGSAVQLPGARTKIFTLLEGDNQNFPKRGFKLFIHFSTFFQRFEHIRALIVHQEPRRR